MKKKLLVVTAAIIIPVIFVGLRRNSAPLFSVEKYQCAQDVVLSDDYFSSINNALADLCNKHCAAHVIIDQLKQQFPVINKITIAYRPAATRITLSAHEPICCINDGLVLTAHKEIFPKHFFSEDALEDVLCVEVAQSSMKNASSLVDSLLQKLPHDISEIYNIELIKEHCVRFIDKQQPQFTIISSIAQEKFAQLCVQCKEIKRAINEKNGFDKGVKWVADTRFAHYIVAYKA